MDKGEKQTQLSVDSLKGILFVQHNFKHVIQRLPRIPLHSAKVNRGNLVFRQICVGSGFAVIKCVFWRAKSRENCLVYCYVILLFSLYYLCKSVFMLLYRLNLCCFALLWQNQYFYLFFYICEAEECLIVLVYCILSITA